jgi:hypothetical protein
MASVQLTNPTEYMDKNLPYTSDWLVLGNRKN